MRPQYWQDLSISNPSFSDIPPGDGTSLYACMRLPVLHTVPYCLHKEHPLLIHFLCSGIQHSIVRNPLLLSSFPLFFPSYWHIVIAPPGIEPGSPAKETGEFPLLQSAMFCMKKTPCFCKASFPVFYLRSERREKMSIIHFFQLIL